MKNSFIFYIFIFFLTFKYICLYSHFSKKYFFTDYSIKLIQSINLNAQYNKKNYSYLMTLCSLLKTYINTHSQDFHDIDASQFYNTKKLLSKFIGEKSGTYNLLTMEPIEFYSGYQASFFTVYDKYSNEEIDEMVYRFALMTEGEAYAGIFQGIPEISFHFLDYGLANAISICYNQISIWDWSIGAEIENEFFREQEIMNDK